MHLDLYINRNYVLICRYVLVQLKCRYIEKYFDEMVKDFFRLIKKID